MGTLKEWKNNAQKLCDFLGRHGDVATGIGGALVLGATYVATGSLLAAAAVTGLGYLAIAKMVTETVPDPYNNIFVTGSRAARDGNILTGVLFVQEGEQVVAYQRELFVSTALVESNRILRAAVTDVEREPTETTATGPLVLLSVEAKGPYWWCIETLLRPKVESITKESEISKKEIDFYNRMREEAGPLRKGSVNRTGAFEDTLSP